MKLDRKLQLLILNELKTHYPADVAVQRMNCFEEGQTFNGNIIYLEEHGLATGKTHQNRRTNNTGPQMLMASITADGLDFLEDDGGLRAILNKVTIKIDPEDLQTLIANRLDKEDITPEKKSEILKAIKSLPADGIKTVYSRLVNLGLDKTPDVIDLIQKLLEQPF